MSIEPRQLLKRILEYIGEQLKEIDPRGFQLDKQSGFRRLPNDVAGLPGVQCDLRQDGDHVWLQVERLEAKSPPRITENQQDLFDVSSDPFGAPPTLRETAIRRRLATLSLGKTEPEKGIIEVNFREGVDRALTTYCDLWVAWAEGEKPRWRTISLYAELFALKHQLEAQETAQPAELVWGIGISTWQLKAPDGIFSFTYPLLTQRVEIALDGQTMMLLIRPRATSAKAELDAFAACKVPGTSEVETSCRNQLTTANRVVTPFDPGSYTDVLKLVASNLDSKGSYREILASHGSIPSAGEHLIVTDLWVLFARPRANHFLVEDLAKLQGRLEQGCDIPEGLLALVSSPSDTPIEYEPIHYRGISSRGEATAGCKAPELFFPLPYNAEQVTIVSRLERAAGVTVQGPPGTGKTHTIANIICHYLALGRRVLVTSRGEPALRVLQSKIPKEVQPLTVALLTNDREGMRQFQASIEAIQHEVSQLDPHQTTQNIENRLYEIDRVHGELTQIDARIDEIALAQLCEIEVDGVAMRAQKIAELIVSGTAQHQWFDDPLSLDPLHAPPLTEDDETRLRVSRRRLRDDLCYVDMHIPSADDLPTQNAITELHTTLQLVRRIDKQVTARTLLPLRRVTPELLKAARELLIQLDTAKALAEELESVKSDWPLELRKKCGIPSFSSARKAFEAIFGDVDHLIAARGEFLQRPVELADGTLNSVKVREAIKRAAESGKPFGLLSMVGGDAKVVVASIKVSGLPPTTAEQWAHVQRYVLLHDQVTSFLARWNHIAEVFPVPKLTGGVGALRTLEAVAITARTAHRLSMNFDATLPRQAERIFETPPVQQICGGSKEIEEVRKTLLQHITRASLARAATELDTIRTKLAGKTGLISGSLRVFVDTLGDESLEARTIVNTYSELITELRRIGALAADLATIQELTRRLDESGATRFGARLRSVPVAESGEDSAFPTTWREAWTWSRLSGHLDRIEAREEIIILSRRRAEHEVGLARLYREVVAKAAWLATKRKASPLVLQALAGYAGAIRRIGMGTGPNAVRYRRDAQESMFQAAGAVPCWIMSHAKISESMPSEIGAFDLVIVDEASQSDLWALPAILRGRKILVVGDDKQVSPEAGFIAAEHIQILRERFLTDQPFGVEMTPEKSLYDLAARVFAAEQVMLREHFRCVPPIIAYSNRHFYKGGIQPLRIPKASERIDPPLVDIYVEGGFRDRRDCNRNEALAIADEIGSILSDVRFDGRSIGVVSLLGMEQAKRIDTEVRRRYPANELLRREFECGDARTFQGSERDIIFLSLVAEPGSRALSGSIFDQRFNVAASRARDRMYLVRSVEMAQLSDSDLRQSLLAHFANPLVHDASETADLLSLCESGFERDVFTRLTQRGYRVIPQVRTGAYRIDMVVEGAADARLAIECDGDEFHGPDRWQQDMHRQRVLERAGWTFWRCFASTWTLNKEEVLQELLERITSMRIEPLGALQYAPSLVDRRIWRAPDDGFSAASE